MYAVTAADEKFRPIIDLWEERVIACGMTPVIYDLGELGRGEPFIPLVKGYETFRKEGYYQLLANGQYKSRAVHKPFIIAHALEQLDDADCRVIKPSLTLLGNRARHLLFRETYEEVF